MKVNSNKPAISAPAARRSTPVSTTKAQAEKATASPAPSNSTASTTASKNERAAKIGERDILSNYKRDQLTQLARHGKPSHANPADGAGVLQDPRQAGLDNGSNLAGIDLVDRSPASDLLDEARGPVGGDMTDIKGSAPSHERRDPLNGAFNPEEQFGQKVKDRTSQRSSGGTETNDPNAQSDGDAGQWAALTFAGTVGALVSNPVGWAGAAGAAVVGGLNYVYDAIIEDMDNDIPETIDFEVQADAAVESDHVEGDGGGGDVSDQTENEAALEYILDNETSPHPDDTSGDNPNPAPTPNLDTRPRVDARDTVRTPVDPYQQEPTAEELQARMESIDRFGPRTQNAIDPGDHGGEVGGDPDAPLPSDLPDEDPVGDPGSPEGPNQPNA